MPQGRTAGRLPGWPATSAIAGRPPRRPRRPTGGSATDIPPARPAQHPSQIQTIGRYGRRSSSSRQPPRTTHDRGTHPSGRARSESSATAPGRSRTRWARGGPYARPRRASGARACPRCERGGHNRRQELTHAAILAYRVPDGMGEFRSKTREPPGEVGARGAGRSSKGGHSNAACCWEQRRRPQGGMIRA
jgi:hypothetical protein